MVQRKKIELTIPTIDLSLLKKIKGGYSIDPAYCIDSNDSHWYVDKEDCRDEEQVQLDDNIDSQYENCSDNDDKYQNAWNDLTPAEKDFLKKHPVAAVDFYENAKQASQRSIELFPNMLGRNDERDAFRHAFWSALDAYEHGADLAREYGNAHEDSDPYQSVDERNMDLHNNEVGYEIGEFARENGWSEEQIEQAILDAIEDGRLVVIK